MARASSQGIKGSRPSPSSPVDLAQRGAATRGVAGDAGHKSIGYAQGSWWLASCNSDSSSCSRSAERSECQGHSSDSRSSAFRSGQRGHTSRGAQQRIRSTNCNCSFIGTGSCAGNARHNSSNSSSSASQGGRRDRRSVGALRRVRSTNRSCSFMSAGSQARGDSSDSSRSAFQDRASNSSCNASRNSSCDSSCPDFQEGPRGRRSVSAQHRIRTTNRSISFMSAGSRVAGARQDNSSDSSCTAFHGGPRGRRSRGAHRRIRSTNRSCSFVSARSSSRGGDDNGFIRSAFQGGFRSRRSGGAPDCKRSSSGSDSEEIQLPPSPSSFPASGQPGWPSEMRTAVVMPSGPIPEREPTNSDDEDSILNSSNVSEDDSSTQSPAATPEVASPDRPPLRQRRASSAQPQSQWPQEASWHRASWRTTNLCHWYVSGHCWRGSQCKYEHVIPEKENFQHGKFEEHKCPSGKENDFECNDEHVTKNATTKWLPVKATFKESWWAASIDSEEERTQSPAASQKADMPTPRSRFTSPPRPPLQHAKRICHQYVKGHCWRGAWCNYVHVIPENQTSDQMTSKTYDRAPGQMRDGGQNYEWVPVNQKAFDNAKPRENNRSQKAYSWRNYDKRVPENTKAEHKLKSREHNRSQNTDSWRNNDELAPENSKAVHKVKSREHNRTQNTGSWRNRDACAPESKTSKEHNMDKKRGDIFSYDRLREQSKPSEQMAVKANRGSRKMTDSCSDCEHAMSKDSSSSMLTYRKRAGAGRAKEDTEADKPTKNSSTPEKSTPKERPWNPRVDETSDGVHRGAASWRVRSWRARGRGDASGDVRLGSAARRGRSGGARSPRLLSAWTKAVPREATTTATSGSPEEATLSPAEDPAKLQIYVEGAWRRAAAAGVPKILPTRARPEDASDNEKSGSDTDEELRPSQRALLASKKWTVTSEAETALRILRGLWEGTDRDGQASRRHNIDIELNITKRTCADFVCRSSGQPNRSIVCKDGSIALVKYGRADFFLEEAGENALIWVPAVGSAPAVAWSRVPSNPPIRHNAPRRLPRRQRQLPRADLCNAYVKQGMMQIQMQYFWNWQQ